MQLTGHYDLNSHSPLNSQQMSPPLEMTFFFPFVKKSINLFVCRKSQDSPTFSFKE